MREDDLERFAVADGLLARMAAEAGYSTQTERDYLLLAAARELAQAGDLSGAEAYRLIYPMTPENRTTIQVGNVFGCVFAFGRLLFTIKRHKLRGICHPEWN